VDAAREGVVVHLLVRGMNCLMPDVDGMPENLEARGLVGRFLEHSRMLAFAGEGKPKVWITSGDWMTRNMDGRVEVSCPIRDKVHRERMLEEFAMQWRDTANARSWDPDQANIRIQGPSFDSHTAIPAWLAEIAAK